MAESEHKWVILLGWGGALLCVLAMLVPGVQAAEPVSGATAEPASVLLEFAGTVEVAPGGQPPWRSAVRGQSLGPGDQVRTRAGSRATVRLSDRSVIRINQLTVVQLGSPTPAAGRRRFRMREGSLYFLNRERPADIEFETPLASGAIRGTEFLLAVEAATGATRLALIDGRVELTSADGRLELERGQEAVIEPGQSVRLTAALPLTALVQWCFYYPGVLDPDDLEFDPGESAVLAASLTAYRAGDLPGARAALPESWVAGSPGGRLYRAALELAFGQVEAAEARLANLPPDSPLAGALRGVVAAVTGADWVPVREPATGSECLADSYYRQSRSDLEGAYGRAVRAVKLAPGFGFAWARLAELEFSRGYRSAARRALAEARRRSPDHAAALALSGFVKLEENRPRPALEDFDAAIALDGALGHAWLGRGLAEARLGHHEAARRDLQTAAGLEPQRALFRSYLGKAWGELGQDALAGKDLALAQRLDPADPTAWLYSALHRHQVREFNDAVRDLERSVDLNDNRSVFRSRLLLDQDRAVRRADLAALYQAVDLDEVAERTAARAIEADYATFSGHLFLARSLQDLEDPARFDLRLETARQSELLVANLLAPAGGANLSQLLSQQDRLEYFDAPPLGVSSFTEYRSSGDWRQAGTVFGEVSAVSYALDGYYHSEAGFAPNTDFERHGYSAQARPQLTAADAVYLQVGYREDQGGDVARHYDPATAVAGLRFREVQEAFVYGGYHREWSPGHHTLFLAARLPDRLDLTNPAPDVLFIRQRGGAPVSVQTDPFSSLDFASDYLLDSIELQQVFESPRHALIAGGRYQSGRVDSDATLTRSLSGVVSGQAVHEDVERLSAYAYTAWRPLDALRLSAGVTYDDLSYPRNADQAPLTEGETSRSRVSPKVGVTWEPWRGGAWRGAWARTLGGLYFDDSVRLEPTQMAGFINTVRSVLPESVVGLVPGTEFESAGIGFDQRLAAGTYLGLAVERWLSDGDRTVGALTNAGPLPIPDATSSTTQTFAYEERSLAAYAHQLLGQCWVLGARYRLGQAELEGRFPDLPDGLPGRAELEQDERSVLHHVQLTAAFNHPTGWFAQWTSHWYSQSNTGYTPDRPGDDFWQHDVAVGYRFARRRAELRVGVLNLADTDYRLNPLNLYSELARERTFYTSLRLNF